MIRINTNDQGPIAVFVIAPEDRHRAGFDAPSLVALTVDEDHFTGSAVLTMSGRWSVVVSMLAGLTPAEVEAEGFEMRRFDGAGWVVLHPSV